MGIYEKRIAIIIKTQNPFKNDSSSFLKEDWLSVEPPNLRGVKF